MAIRRDGTSRGTWYVAVLSAALTLAAFGAARADEPILAQEATPVPAATPAPLATPAGYPNPFDGNWHTTLAPYIWAPNLNGTLAFQVPPRIKEGGSALVNVKAGPNDYLSSLNFALMFSAEARKGNFSLLGDYVNANLSTSTGTVTSISGPHGHFEFPISLTTDSRMTGTLWLLAPSFTVAHGSAGNVDLLAGVRGLTSTVSATWNLTAGSNDIIDRSGSISQGVSLTDFVVGTRGKVNLGSPRWFIPYYVDFGWGSNNSTWRGQIAIGTAARHGQSWIFGVRTVQYNMTNNGVLQSLRLTGPGLGYTFMI